MSNELFLQGTKIKQRPIAFIKSYLERFPCNSPQCSTESKPKCLRCQKHGRMCNGYAHEAPSRGSMMPIQPRIPTADFYAPSISLEATEEEVRYFCDCTAYQLPGYFDSSFWNHIILQESHSISPIRHAVIAIGALNKAVEEAPGPHLKVNVIQDTNKKHLEFAVLRHLKAFQALNQYLSRSNGPQLRTALMARLLFVCFETIQGSYASSVQQIYGGLKLLRSYYAETPGSKPWIPRRISRGFSTNPQVFLPFRGTSILHIISLYHEHYKV